MLIPKKSRYALRAIFELARRYGQGPVKIADIARPQAIPQRFLEAILNQLRQAGLVESRRGSEGGYILAREPKNLTVGDILRTVQGLPEPVECMGENPEENCPLRPNCPFLPMWEEMKSAVKKVYDSTTFADLLERQAQQARQGGVDYTI